MVDQITSILDRIETALDTMRPYLKADGGDIEVSELTDDWTLKVNLLGSCRTCPMSYQTMKAGIEEAVKKAVPQVQKVVAINLSNE